MFCGTPSFMAPEIVRKEEYRGPPVDIWALGVVLFVMLTGSFPFKGSTDKELYSRICSSQHPSIDYLSVQAQDLLRLMLTVDAGNRITGRAVLEHDWFKPSSRVVEKKPSFVEKEAQGYESRWMDRQRPAESRDKKKFNMTESHILLKEILRNAQLSPQPGKAEEKNEGTSSTTNNTNTSKVSTPLQ